MDGTKKGMINFPEAKDNFPEKVVFVVNIQR